MIGVVILNYEKYELTIKCVEMIRNFPLLKIVVVDNKSKNNSFDVLTHTFNDISNVDVIQSEKNGGYSYGNNYGIHFLEKNYTNVEYICIINPDVEILNTSLFLRYVDILRDNPDIGIVTSFQILNSQFGGNVKGYWNIPYGVKSIFDSTYFGRLFREKKPEVFARNNNLLLNVDAVVGSLFMISLAYLKNINYLDDGVFLYYEENILGVKIHNAGLKIAILMDTFYYHHHTHNDAYNNSLGSLLKNLNITLKSKKYFMKNYLNKSNVSIYLSSFFWYFNTGLILIIWILKKLRKEFKI